MREIRKSGSMRGSGRKALLRKCHLSLSTLPVSSSAGLSGNNVEGIQILTTLNTSNETIEHSPEASRPAEHFGPALGDIQSQLSTPFDRPSLTTSIVFYDHEK